MKYLNIIEGIFIERINRFIATVLVDEKEELVHVKNTGRCKELFIKGRTVYLERSNNPNRKTKYSLISIYKDNKLINIDSQVPNQVVFEAIKSNSIEGFENLKFIKREQTYGNSRFDIYYETDINRGFIEVKGVTLENNGIASFPDAPTKRGKKHLDELVLGQNEGYENYIFFLIQLENVNSFIPNFKTDPEFATSLKKARDAGVKILCYNSLVTSDSIVINKRISY